MVFEYDIANTHTNVYLGRKTAYSYTPPVPTPTPTPTGNTTNTTTPVVQTTSSPESSGASIPMIVGISVGVAALLCCLCLLGIIGVALIVFLVTRSNASKVEVLNREMDWHLSTDKP